MALKIGIVGMGGIGHTHASAYVNDPLSELYAVCDVNKARADEAAEKYKVRAFYSLREMLDAYPELDVVDVTTSGYENGSLHFEPALQALEAGKTTIVEKPLCADIEDARYLVRYAESKGLYLGCNLNHYFTETAEKADSYIAAGDIGELVYCIHKVGFNGGDEGYGGAGDPSSRWRKPYSHCKAFLTHPFSVMRHFCGDVSHVQAFLDKPGVRRTAADPMLSINSIHMRFVNGGIGYLLSQRGDAQFGLGGWWSYEHAGTRGTFSIENCVAKLTYWSGPRKNAEGKVETPAPEVFDTGISSFDATFPSRLHCFLEDVTNGVARDYLRSSGRDALATLEYIQAAIVSYEEGGALVRPE